MINMKHLSDVHSLHDKLLAAGRGCPMETCYSVWLDYSEYMCAEWMSIPKDVVEIVRIFDAFFTPESILPISEEEQAQIHDKDVAALEVLHDYVFESGDMETSNPILSNAREVIQKLYKLKID
jgi:hypothetical protein